MNCEKEIDVLKSNLAYLEAQIKKNEFDIYNLQMIISEMKKTHS
ncbi:hypothetical protein [Enterococcus sp. SMC-9]|nr:hypothetical protein [Enterococcus sp. SMC-9]